MTHHYLSLEELVCILRCLKDFYGRRSEDMLFSSLGSDRFMRHVPDIEMYRMALKEAGYSPPDISKRTKRLKERLDVFRCQLHPFSREGDVSALYTEIINKILGEDTSYLGEIK